MAQADGVAVLAPKELIIPINTKGKTNAVSGMLFISGMQLYFTISGANSYPLMTGTAVSP